jgi:hypothetical protein
MKKLRPRKNYLKKEKGGERERGKEKRRGKERGWREEERGWEVEGVEITEIARGGPSTS